MTGKTNLLSGPLLARNVAWNFAGSLMPLLLAFWGILNLIQRMGGERVGLPDIVRAAIGHFSLLNFGISAGLAKPVSRRVGKDETSDATTKSQQCLGEACVPSGYDLDVIDQFVFGCAEHLRPPRFRARSASVGIVERCGR